MGKVDEALERFVSHFRNQLGHIDTVKSSGDPDRGDPSPLYKKILYVAVLDCLAKPVFPRRNNRDRFIAFVDGFCGWKHGQRVSLPHLVQLLRLNPDPAFQQLRTWANGELAKWSVHMGGIAQLDVDPDFKSVISKWPTEKEYRVPIENVGPESLRHLNLLYAYRNSLVHEFREPGAGMEFAETEHPHYHHLSTIGDSQEIVAESIELVYPIGFFKRLCEVGLTQFTDYMTQNKLNPMDYFRFGSYWIREMND